MLTGATSNPHAPRRGERRFLRASRIPRRGRLEKNDFRLLVRGGAMLDSVWNDDEFSRTQLNRAISKFDPHPAAPDEKELIFSLVMMPRENALEFDHLHLLAIQLADDFRPPMFAESGELFFQAHLFHEVIVAGVADPGYSERTLNPSRG